MKNEIYFFGSETEQVFTSGIIPAGYYTNWDSNGIQHLSYCGVNDDGDLPDFTYYHESFPIPKSAWHDHCSITIGEEIFYCEKCGEPHSLKNKTYGFLCEDCANKAGVYQCTNCGDWYRECCKCCN